VVHSAARTFQKGELMRGFLQELRRQWSLGIPFLGLLMIFVPTPIHTAVTTSDPFQTPAYRKAFFDAAKTYGKKGCGDQALAELTATVAIKNAVPANLMAAIVGIESSCNPLANNGIAVGIAQINVQAHKDEYDFSKINLFNAQENLEVGAEILAKSLKVWGPRQGVAHYNGVGPTAEKYAADVLALAGK
jgi:soluble lytic murein transglycosylase-like protein